MSTSPLCVSVSVDVSVSDLRRNVFHVDGTLCYADHTLILEYQESDVHRRVTSTQTTELQLDDLRDVRLRRGFLGATLVVRPQRLALMDALPGDHPDKLVCSIASDDRSAAAQLATQVQRELADQTDLQIPPIPFSLPDTVATWRASSTLSESVV